jgi:pimeloyl-ACP methyl ester carboxylesterase
VRNEPVPLVCVPGTWDNQAAWCFDPAHPWHQAATAAGFHVIPFDWLTLLSGILWINRGHWQRTAHERLVPLLLPLSRVHLVAHSHGGQVAFHAITELLRVHGRRTVTLSTVATPARRDTGALDAAQCIDTWQHIYDRDWDKTGATPRRIGGQIGDGHLGTDRSFKWVPGVVRVPLRGISHSRILREEPYVSLWNTQGLFATILEADWKHVRGGDAA